jgi:Rieske Fe-S protein
VRKQDGWRVSIAKQTVYVTRIGDKLQVLSAVCSHLGCIVPWDASSKVFACPCHRGIFAPDGARISGPPPRGLDPLPTKIENGTLYVQYQYFRQLSAKREVLG